MAPPMLEVADALAVVLRHTRRMPAESWPLERVTRGVLAADVRADRDSPPFDKSLRDGYAVRAADCVGGVAELSALETVAAGAVPTRSIGPGECARLFTGAPIPDGADAVVMQEQVEAAGEGRVRVNDPAVAPGRWVFARGRESRAGDVVVPAGTPITPAVVGVLATVGAATMSSYCAPTVAVIATGNELVEVNAEPGPGQIRNSNGLMLAAMASRDAVPLSREMAADNRDALRRAVGGALDRHNVVLVAGGVSVGDFDLVPEVLAELGVETHVRTVRMKPGKPLLFGTRGDTLVFGLPGNPVSAFVGFELFVRPALRRMAGYDTSGPPTAVVPLAEPFVATNDRPTYHPAKLDGGTVRPLPFGGAPDLRGLMPADALLSLPAGDVRLAAGDPVTVVLI